MTFQNLYDKILEENKREEFLVYYENKKRMHMSSDYYKTLVDIYANNIKKALKAYDAAAWIGIRCKNSVYYLALFFGVLKSGHPVVLLDENSTMSQLNNFASNSNMKVVITDTECASDGNYSVIKLKDILEKKAEEEALVKETEWSDKIIFVTSGTTSEAKMYMFKAETLLMHNEQLAGFWKSMDQKYNLAQDKRVLQLLPLRHCFGFGTFIGYLRFGYTLVFPENISVFEIIRTIREEEIWLSAMVPAVWKGMLTVLKVKSNGKISESSFEQLFGPHFKCSICAGTKVSSELIQQIHLVGITLLGGWGMTEIGMAVIGEITEKDISNGYVGEVLPWYDIAIENEDGTKTKYGVGELLVDRNVAFDAKVTKNGFEALKAKYFYSGDIFKVDGSSCYFLGRKKSVIINDSGENVYPEEIEDELSEIFSEARQSCIFGINDVVAAFIADPEAKEKEARWIEMIREKNKTLQLNRKVAVVYLSEELLKVTGKGELSRFYVAKCIEEKQKFKKIVLLKGIFK